MLIALLDYDCINPITRLVKKKNDTLQAAIMKLRADMMKQDEKQSIGQIKKQLGVGKKKKKGKVDKFELMDEDDQIVEKQLENLKLD